jgi:ABC-type sugar transport system substrate-binding protein
MNHPKKGLSFLLFGLALATASMAGQQSKPAPSSSAPSNSSTSSSSTQKGGHIPCAKQAGISPQVLQQRRAIMEAAKTKIQGVCQDNSLSAQQKKEQIHQIHQEASQQAEALIPAAQLEALKKCQASANGGVHVAHTTGPCGEPLEPQEETPAQPN